MPKRVGSPLPLGEGQGEGRNAPGCEVSLTPPLSQGERGSGIAPQISRRVTDSELRHRIPLYSASAVWLLGAVEDSDMNALTTKPGSGLVGRHAIVIGSGITGLAAALVLSRRGARVTVLERDPQPEVGSAAEAFTAWERKGATQVRHSHAFLGRLRKLLRESYPDLLDALLEAGARELRMMLRS